MSFGRTKVKRNCGLVLHVLLWNIGLRPQYWCRSICFKYVHFMHYFRHAPPNLPRRLRKWLIVSLRVVQSFDFLPKDSYGKRYQKEKLPFSRQEEIEFVLYQWKFSKEEPATVKECSKGVHSLNQSSSKSLKICYVNLSSVIKMSRGSLYVGPRVDANLDPKAGSIRAQS